ncbi:MAG: TIGR02302 family protein [Alphaproteobacteria bacterium]
MEAKEQRWHGAGPELGSYVSRRLRLARAALLWEQAWPALWPAVFIAGVALALALFDLLPRLPGWLHGLVLAGFAAAFAAAVWHGARRLRLPDVAAARRRLERASGLAHRPLTVAVDRLAIGQGDPAALALWRAHRERMLAALKRLKVGIPAAGLARRDPWGVRAILALALILAVVDAGGEAPRRLADALSPKLAGLGGPAAALSIWIAPPEYTGVAPIVLEPGQAATDSSTAVVAAAAISVPAGSTLLARVSGGRGVPSLTVGDEVIAFSAVEDHSYTASAEIAASGLIAVSQDHVALGAWRVAVVADAPPSADFARPPSATDRAALRLDARARDDYGVAELSAVIHRPGGGGESGADEGFEIALPLPGSAPREVENTSYHDLTAHPWAGLEVVVWLEARDAIGQAGRSEALAATLPERVFRHPVARAIVAERKRLSENPGGRRKVARALSAIADEPARYGHDTVVFLALKMARTRLLLDPEKEAVAEVQRLLWDTALRIEDGDLSLAQRELREIERALLEALAEGTDRAEIERLMDEFEAAMNRYLDALTQGAEEGPAAPEQLALVDPSAEVVDRGDLLGLLERARELARTGDLDAARELLSRLQDVLENMHVASAGAEGAQALEAMEGLRDLVERQQELLDRTFRRARPRPPPRPGQPAQPRDPEANARDAAAQEALRRDLGDMMLELGEMLGRIPGPLGRAERAMREAAEALTQGEPGQAVDPQTRALDELRQGAQAAAEALMQQLQQAGVGLPSPGRGQRRDPLGRRLPGEDGWQMGTVRIPDEMELRRAREILEELRRRAGEPHRPPLEQDYIERLLPEF